MAGDGAALGRLMGGCWWRHVAGPAEVRDGVGGRGFDSCFELLEVVGDGGFFLA